jgi:hypothetical protein
MTGSILSVASEDGKVRLFKGEYTLIVWEDALSGWLATYAGDWGLYGTFSAEAPDVEANGEAEGRMQE